MEPMRIGYGKAISITFLVLGILLLLIGLVSTDWIGLFLGVVLTLLGVLMLVNPFIKVDPGEVRLLSPLGFTSKRFPLSSPADLRVDGKALVFVPTGKKIAALGYMVDGGDADRLRARLPGPAA